MQRYATPVFPGPTFFTDRTGLIMHTSGSAPFARCQRSEAMSPSAAASQMVAEAGDRESRLPISRCGVKKMPDARADVSAASPGGATRGEKKGVKQSIFVKSVNHFNEITIANA